LAILLSALRQTPKHHVIAICYIMAAAVRVLIYLGNQTEGNFGNYYKLRGLKI